MAATTFTEPYSNGFRTDSRKDSDITESAWMSFTKLQEFEPQAIIRLMVNQGKVLTWPHELLGLGNPEVQQLPGEFKLQSKYVQDKEVLETATQETMRHEDG